ncbi:hypothetical protein ACIRYZ_00045 [Kitasatospora sp. NPDC101155]|uniref:hypothetical protein n=1 Tax=Kitasatospora sp. NPDC101155 TaxID=3364097 RepID=UPI00381B6D0C
MVSPGAAAARGFLDRCPEPDRLPGWLTEQDIAVYAEALAATGFTGGLNWYRNLHRNWEVTAALADFASSLDSPRHP